MRILTAAVGLSIVAGSAGGVWAGEGTASGEITVGTSSVMLLHATAHRVTHPFDEKKQAIEVLLSDRPFEAKALAGAESWSFVFSGKPQQGVYLLLSQEGAILSAAPFHDELRKKGSVSRGGGEARAFTLKPESLGAAVEDRDDFSGLQWHYAASFQVPLEKPAPGNPSAFVKEKETQAQVERPPAPAWQPLPAGGGEPGRVLMEFWAAAAKGWPAPKKYMTEGSIQMAESLGQRYFDALKAGGQEEDRIVEAFVAGDRAKLKMKSGMFWYLVKVGKEWKVDLE